MQKRKFIKVQSLKDAETKDKCQATLDEKTDLRGEVDEGWEALQDTSKGVAQETLGTNTVEGRKKIHTSWWTEKVECAAKEKVKTLRKWLRLKTPETRLKCVSQETGLRK